MAIINPLPYTIANGDPVDATPVEANFSQIVSDVNANAALVGGSASQQFLVATTANPAGAVPLAQAQAQFAALNGSGSQQFLVATTANPAGAVPLAQAQAQFAALNGSGSQNFAADVVTAAQLNGGSVSGTTGTFSGAVSGTTGTFSGAVSGATGTFSGAVSGTTGAFSGAVSGATGTFSGLLTASGGLASTAQPAFSATGIANQTSGNTIILPSYTEQGGSNYNSSTGVFTAPSNGWYLFTANVAFYNNTGSNSSALEIGIGPSGGIWYFAYPSIPTSTSGVVGGSAIFYLAAGTAISLTSVSGLSSTFWVEAASFFSGVKLF